MTKAPLMAVPPVVAVTRPVTVLIESTVICASVVQEPPPTTTTEEPAKPCTCKNFLLGYFEMEDCQLYLPTESPFSCPKRNPRRIQTPPKKA